MNQNLIISAKTLLTNPISYGFHLSKERIIEVEESTFIALGKISLIDYENTRNHNRKATNLVSEYSMASIKGIYNRLTQVTDPDLSVIYLSF